MSTMTINSLGYRIEHMPASAAPPDLWTGLELNINPHWAWCAVDSNDRVVAALLTTPAHGILLLLRIWQKPGTPSTVLRQLLREVSWEVRGLGLTGWMVMLEATQPKELRILKLLLRLKGQARGFGGFMVAGRLEDACHRL